MRAPAFWQTRGWQSDLLEPFGLLVSALARRRHRHATAFDPGVPVICIGNLTVGGQGKTPVVLDLAKRLTNAGRRPAILSRGYKGCLSGVRVDPAQHSNTDVGDEPLLLAEIAPTYVDPDRAASARLAVADCADCLLMDDGFQNPGLKKHLSFVVVDGGSGFGNGLVIPAGPLRENPRDGLARADAVILIGEDRLGLLSRLEAVRPVLRARLVPRPIDLSGPIVAFAGIGRPGKFFDSLRSMTANMVDTIPFDDHHPYDDADWRKLQALAKTHGARLVTTAKDYVRLRADWKSEVAVLTVDLDWSHPDSLMSLLERVL
ncbi:tetraacyldisaccharide 4'-kinase [Lacibacterium aquatile]|uniref:Tetraacyldisaccharide 4'-kinase n=1 Tax=Lacibacterium aquatile TaxID=1168082 RepID=A0ABW5DXD1_9PROT